MSKGKWIAIGISSAIGLIVFMIIFAILSFAFSWFSAGKDIVSPQNVKTQYQFAFDDINALKAKASQVCRAEELVKNETDPNAKIQRESQLNAQQNRYDQIRAEYDARMADLFRAKIVKPTNVPSIAPTLEEMKMQVC